MPKLVELLQPARRPGFPSDYLIARLASRRAVRLNSCPAGNSEEARRDLELELDWFHSQLEPKVRSRLAPVLIFFELPGLLAALRFNEAGDHRGARACLKNSRLHRKFGDLLEKEKSYPETLRELGTILAPFAGNLAAPDRIRNHRGRSGLELILVDVLMTIGKREQPTGVIALFLDQLNDRRNLLRLAKAVRWPDRLSPPGLPGPLARHYRRVLTRKTNDGSDPAALDRNLLGSMALDWRRRSLSGGRMEQILDYLWTCFLAARDCGIRQLAELLGEERVALETIL